MNEEENLKIGDGAYLYSLLIQHTDGSWWYYPRNTFCSPEEVEAKFEETYWWSLDTPHMAFKHKEPMYQEHSTCSFGLKKFHFGGLVRWPKANYGELLGSAIEAERSKYNYPKTFPRPGWDSCKPMPYVSITDILQGVERK